MFPVVSPIGYAAEKNTLVDTLFRKVEKSDQRKPWPELFFENNFTTSLTEVSACEYAFLLEMHRLVSSAAHRQPRQVILKNDAFHFYREDNSPLQYQVVAAAEHC